MASDRPDPGEFFDMAQRMLREMFSSSGSDADPWAEATRRPGAKAPLGREPSPGEQRENLTFALATRAVEALEDLALNVAAVRQRLERLDPQASGAKPEIEGPGTKGADPDQP
jgi:hypothetical protein